MNSYTPHVLTASARAHAAYDIVGDVHGCWDELCDLLRRAGWEVDEEGSDPTGPIHARHPEGRLLVFAGDLTDRGPGSDRVLRLALGMMAQDNALWVIGNHDWKLARSLHGNPVKVQAGLQTTLTQIEPLGCAFKARVMDAIFSLPFQVRLPMPANHARAGDGFMTVVHGAAPDHHLDGGQKNSFERSIYGYGEGLRDDGSLRRRDWAADYTMARWIVHGHEPFAAPRVLNKVIAIDTGCVFGNALTLYRADEMTYLSVPARTNHSGKIRAFY